MAEPKIIPYPFPPDGGQIEEQIDVSSRTVIEKTVYTESVHVKTVRVETEETVRTGLVRRELASGEENEPEGESSPGKQPSMQTPEEPQAEGESSPGNKPSMQAPEKTPAVVADRPLGSQGAMSPELGGDADLSRVEPGETAEDEETGEELMSQSLQLRRKAIKHPPNVNAGRDVSWLKAKFDEIDSRGVIQINRITGRIALKRDIAFVRRSEMRDRPTALCSSVQDASENLKNVAWIASVLDTRLLVEVYSGHAGHGGAQARSHRGFWYEELADSRLKLLKTQLVKFGVKSHRLTCKIIHGKNPSARTLPEGHQCVKFQLCLGVLRYGLVSAARLKELERRSRIRVDLEAGTISFLDEIRFVEQERQSGTIVKLASVQECDKTLSGVVELYESTGCHLSVETHVRPERAQSETGIGQALLRARLVRDRLLFCGVPPESTYTRCVPDSSHLGRGQGCIILRTDLKVTTEPEDDECKSLKLSEQERVKSSKGWVKQTPHSPRQDSGAFFCDSAVAENVNPRSVPSSPLVEARKLRIEGNIAEKICGPRSVQRRGPEPGHVQWQKIGQFVA